jgi:hypothetical protein
VFEPAEAEEEYKRDTSKYKGTRHDPQGIGRRWPKTAYLDTEDHRYTLEQVRERGTESGAALRQLVAAQSTASGRPSTPADPSIPRRAAV